MKIVCAETVDLVTVRAQAKNLADRLGIRNLIVYGTPRGDGSPHVEVSDAYYFVVQERGIELERRRTSDLDELLYWIFDTVTFAASSAFELRHRVPGQDVRRALFAQHEELLSRLSPAWRNRKVAEHRAILAKHPFQDGIC